MHRVHLAHWHLSLPLPIPLHVPFFSPTVTSGCLQELDAHAAVLPGDVPDFRRCRTGSTYGVKDAPSLDHLARAPRRVGRLKVVGEEVALQVASRPWCGLIDCQIDNGSTVPLSLGGGLDGATFFWRDCHGVDVGIFYGHFASRRRCSRGFEVCGCLWD